MIYDGNKYKIDNYLNKIDKVNNDFLDASIYNYCKKCRKNINKYFCKNCNQNLCGECYKELKCFENEHVTWDLNYIIKNNYINNIREIKNILNNNIIPIKEEDEIIQKIKKYIDINLINNDKYIENNNNNNLIDDVFLLNKSKENNDILLINKIISEDYINYFHYKNIEKILDYIRDTYNTKDNIKYNGYGKKIYENDEYYIGEFKNGLRDGKGIFYYNNEKLMFFGDFNGDKFEGTGHFMYQKYNYYIGEWKDNLRYGKGILNYKSGAKYQGDWVDDKANGYGKITYQNGEYYIGEMKNDLKQGKGILYYKNGNILYDGEFMNNKYEGKGKYIYETGDYYIGEWKNNLKHGRGIIFDENGNIKYDCEFIKNAFGVKREIGYVERCEYYLLGN